MIEGTQSEYAKYRGCTPAAVSEAIKKGRLRNSLRRVGKRYRVNFEKADEEWRTVENLTILDDLPEPEPDHEPEPDILSNGNLSYGEARTQTEIHKARLARLDFLKKKGDLVEVEAIRKEIFGIFRVMRDRLLASPPRWAHVALSAESEAAAILAIKAELNQVLADTQNAVDSRFSR